MVLDTSVLLHIFFEEPSWEETVVYLLRQPARLFSVASLVEAQAVVVGRTNADAAAVLDELLHTLGLTLVPLDLEQAQLARAAYLRYGKGQGHRAGLNYGDVMAYALAKQCGEMLAFVGDDFNHTDLAVVRSPRGQ